MESVWNLNGEKVKKLRKDGFFEITLGEWMAVGWNDFATETFEDENNVWVGSLVVRNSNEFRMRYAAEL